MEDKDSSIGDKEQDSVKFLIEEYKNLKESFLANEELGERRVNFFITLTTAVIGAMAATWKILDGSVTPEAYSLGLFSVFLFGLITLKRIIRRNLVTHEYLRALGRIRAYFAQRDPDIRLYLPYEPYDDKPQRKLEWGRKSLKKFFSTGGLVEMVSLINGLLLGGSFLLLTLRLGVWWIYGLCGVLGFALASYGQLSYVKNRYEEGKPKDDTINFPKPN